MRAALRAARLTDGDVDPTLGEALIALGYDRDFDELSSAGRGDRVAAPLGPIAAIRGWRTVVRRSGGRARSEWLRRVSLDLGATAKALAADRAADLAQLTAGCGVLVSFGGDLAVAGPAPEDGWRVRVTDDHRAGVDAPGQWITLRSGGLATSSTTVRRWRTAAGETSTSRGSGDGAPADSVWRTVSVTAASCLDANIASTAAIVRGAEAADWLEALGLPSRLVGVDGTVRHLAGWPAEATICQRWHSSLRDRIVCRWAARVSPGFAATLGPSAYWYLARGTGAVALVLLTASVVLGDPRLAALHGRAAVAALRGRRPAPRRVAAGHRGAGRSTSSPACSTASRRSR